MTRKKWSEDEEAYIEYYLYDGEEKDYNAASEFLDRTHSSIMSKVSDMRKKDEKVHYILRPFTEKEVGFIRTNYKKMTAAAIADRLCRTESAIITKAHELGVSKRKQLRFYDSEIRRLAAEGCYRSEIARILSLNAVSVHQYINRHGIECEYAPKEVFQEHAKKYRLNFGKKFK